MSENEQGSVFDDLELNSSIAESAVQDAQKRKRSKIIKILAAAAICVVVLFVASYAMTEATLPQMLAGKSVYYEGGDKAYTISQDGHKAYWVVSGKTWDDYWKVEYGSVFGLWNRSVKFEPDSYSYLIEEDGSGKIILKPTVKTASYEGKQYEVTPYIVK